MKFLVISILFLAVAIPAQSQIINGSQKISEAQYQSEIDKAIAAYPNGKWMYRESDNFERLIHAHVAKKLGLTRSQSSANDNSKFQTQSLSEPSDITLDSDDEDEASIAISRTNPNLIVAGANDLPSMNINSMPAYVSTNGGQTWQTNWLPAMTIAEVQAYGDPMIICDDSGLFYYAFLISSESNSSGFGFISDLMVARSMDGIHWTLGSSVLGNTVPDISSEDKETIAVDRDPSSPRHGWLYIEWTHFVGEYNYALRLISHSSNHGITWSKPDTIRTNYGYFAMMRVGKNGDVFIGSSYRDTSTDEGTCHTMMVSHDAGKTFTESIISAYTNYPEGNYPNELKGGVKAFPYVNFDVDPNNNKIFAVYGSYIPKSNSGYAAQYAVTSTDEGISWSPPEQIGKPDLFATDHFQPWVSFDQASGRVLISMYSSEDDSLHNLLTRMVIFDFQDPSTPQAIGTDTFDPTQVYGGRHGFIGDYTGADVYNGTLAVSWTEKNPVGSDGDVFAYVGSPTPFIRVTKINFADLDLQTPYPNPAAGNSVSLVATSSVSSEASLTLFDINGRACVSSDFALTPGQGNTLMLDVHSLCAGVYRAVLRAGGNSVEKNIIVLH